MLENKCHVFRTAWPMELWSSLRWEEIVNALRFAVHVDKCVAFDTPPPSTPHQRPTQGLGPYLSRDQQY